MKTKINGKIILLGCGGVGSGTLYYLTDFFDFKPKQVYFIDKDPKVVEFPTTKRLIEKGYTFINYTITRYNFPDLLEKIIRVKAYDIVIDLTTCTETNEILMECRSRRILYFNTSIEDDHILSGKQTCPIDSTIFLQHYNIQLIAEKTRRISDNITTIIECGMNPGLISICVKQGILDIADRVIEKGLANDKLKEYRIRSDFHNIAKELKIRTIHCSEIDTQIPKKEINHDFINTWSAVGLITEGIEPAEIAIGTHERIIPFKNDNVMEPIPQMLVTRIAGEQIKCKSLVPLKINEETNEVEFTSIVGSVIHHGESQNLSNYLGDFDYAPTTHYVYQLNPITEMMMNYYTTDELVEISKDPERWKVLNIYDDGVEGYDNVGAMFALEEDPLNIMEQNATSMPFYYWTGSILSTEYTKNVLDDQYFTPTVIQVVVTLLASVCWAIENPHKGLCYAEDIDHDYIMHYAKKYLNMHSLVAPNNLIDGYTLEKLIINNEKIEYTKRDDL